MEIGRSWAMERHQQKLVLNRGRFKEGYYRYCSRTAWRVTERHARRTGISHSGRDSIVVDAALHNGLAGHRDLDGLGRIRRTSLKRAEIRIANPRKIL